MGRDKFGGEQVSLTPSKVPHDVYAGVAELVKVAVHKDAQQGHQTAKVIDGKITRKVCLCNAYPLLCLCDLMRRM